MRQIDQQFLQGWGRHGGATSTVLAPNAIDELATAELPHADLIARGLGRSYGDAAQRSGGSVVITTDCATVHWLDRDAGIVRADAGVSIGQLIDRFTPKGWFVPVTPGTRQVTVGGAIAADIHGKNHHVDGSFGQHVISLRLRLANHEIVTVSPTQSSELFWATVAGMGLTGVIIDADIQLVSIPTSIVAVETQRLSQLDALLDQMRRSDDQHDFSVAWVDLLGDARSVLTQGSFATPAQAAALGRLSAAGTHRRPPTPNISLPRLPLPRVAITPAVKAFNELWWRKAPAELTVTGESITAFFHPLDAITDWNRVYGRTGFVQWQCVVPDNATTQLYDLVERLGDLPSYFTVLKRFGPGNAAPLSFPAPGWTLAVDLPATTKVLAALPALDHIVANAGGRIYLAKDARMTREVFEQMYQRLDDFKAVRATVDPNRRFRSDLSERLGL
ncbi:UNVERIFIED_CONTAM: hypothetical protein GTU68_001940 [Idotea baltica]|nr:hypothetical protein [Idotea baltica]